MPRTPGLSEEQLLSVLEQEETDAVGYFRTEIAEDQETALDYYYGKPFGDEVDGRSQVVSLDVRETVEWLIPDMARIFMSGDQVAEAIPQGPEDVEAAKQATEYCNFVFLQDNPGFRLWQDWAKDGMIQKIGIMRVDWEEPQWGGVETFHNLNTADLEKLQQREEADEAEVIEHEETEVEPGPYYFDGFTHMVRVRRKKPWGRVVISPVAPEEFLVKRVSRDLESASYKAHRTYKTLSELMEEFPEHADELWESIPGDNDEDMDTRRESRFHDEEYYPSDAETPVDRASTLVKFVDEYIRVDFDGDGVAEFRNVKRAGRIILFNEECDDDPFVDWCPIRVPHKFYGLSQADETMDIQRIKSVLWRSALDSTYQQVAGREAVLDGKVNMDDLLTLRAGQKIRVDPTVGDIRNVIMPLTTPDVTPSVYQMLEYVDQEAEGRTGISRYSQGLDPDTLNKTATGIQLLQNASNGRKEMIARNMAFGLEKLFRKILKHLAQNESAKRIIRLRGNRFQPMDPTAWNPDMDMKVHVGLGTGSREQQMANLGFILANQKEIMLNAGPDNPVVGWEHLHAALSELTNTAGFKDTDAFFRDPQDAPPQEPKPDPEVQKEQIKAQAKQAELQQKAQSDQAELQQQGQLKAQEIVFERQKVQEEIAAKREQLVLEIQFKQWAFEQELGLKRWMHEQELEMKRELGIVSEASKVEQAKLKTDAHPGGEPG